MKKKGIVIAIIGILLILILLLIINSNDKSKTFREDGVLIALTVDGINQTSFPSRGNYKVDIDCKNGKGKWLVDEWKFAVEEITGNVTCNISFTTKTDADNLATKIASLKGSTSGTGSIVDEGDVIDTNATFISAIPLEQSEYNNLSNNLNYAWTWDDTAKTWTSIISDENTKSEISFTPKSNGVYQICYKKTSGFYDYASASIDNKSVFSSQDPQGVYSTESGYKCKYVGELTTDTTIKVIHNKSSSSSVGGSFIFSIQKGQKATVSEGIRYEGQNPNNYIWFNNEMWRIIGLIPAKSSSGTNETLIKIIRKDLLGGYAYDGKFQGSTSIWGNNTLYTLLNSYYWGKLDGTDSEYCNVYESNVKTKCDYRVKGIKNNDYYGNMIREVYWNTGLSDYEKTASEVYTNELTTQTVKGYVGLMNASDYGYATSASHTRKLSSYGNTTYTLGNWLYSNTYEWTITQHKSTTVAVNVVGGSGNMSRAIENNGQNTRPVVYLDSKVYVVSGDGTEANPYIIAKEV